MPVIRKSKMLLSIVNVVRDDLCTSRLASKLVQVLADNLLTLTLEQVQLSTCPSNLLARGAGVAQFSSECN